ncbi:MAG TPA: cyclomaltodextrinase N-terminal domain-containing protein, partial [Bacteroidales bacterium]
MSKKILTFILLMSLSIVGMYAQPSIERIEPANWWVGMKNPHLILLVYGKNVAKSNVKLADNSIALLEKIEKTDNANYLFVYLSVKSKAKAGDIAISFSGREKDTVVKYSFLERKSKADGKAGFNPTDAMYLITPDRFANGNPKNDSIAGYTDTTDRRKPDSRHGGDIAGISQHLGY